MNSNGPAPKTITQAAVSFVTPRDTASITHRNSFSQTSVRPPQTAEQKHFETMAAEILAEVAKNQAAIISKYGSKQAYFAARKIAYPAKPEERRKLAKDILQSIFAKHDKDKLGEAAYLLFDPKVDKLDADWANTIGNLIDEDEYKFFNPVLAFQISVFNALANDGFNSAISAYGLGYKYLKGYECEIDIDKARFWFKLAYEKGHGCALNPLYEIFTNYDPRYDRENPNEFTKQIDAAYAESKAPPVMYNHAQNRLWRGINAQLQAGAVKDTLEIANGGTPMAARAQWRLAARSLLGVGMKQDAKLARDLVSKVPDIDDASSQDMQVANRKIKTIKLIEAVNGPLAKEYKLASEALCTWYHKEDNGKAFQNLIAGWRGQKEAMKAARNTLWLFQELANEEGWRIEGQLGAEMQKLRTQQIGTTYETLKHSTMTMGPNYNQIATSGLPILGALLKAANAPLAPSNNSIFTNKPPFITRKGWVHTQPLSDWQVTSPGIVKFEGLRATQHGYVEFIHQRSNTSPAFLTQEDFDVAMALTFIEPNKAIVPWLSVEDADINLTDGHKYFEEKVWHPTWLGNTDLGRTLYITDVLIGCLAWSPYLFEISADLPQKVQKEIKDFLLNIHNTGGRDTRATSKRVMLVPEHVHIEGQQPKIVNGRATWDMRVKSVNMRIDGSYILKRDENNEDRMIALNNETYQQGRLTQKLTRNYDRIAEYIPVFERARQLVGLLQSLRVLRETGFKPHPDLMAKIKKDYSRYASRPKLGRNELLITPFPHN